MSTTPQDPPPTLVLVGASAGGLTVLQRLLADLPASLPATVVAVVHLPSRPRQALVQLVSERSRLPVHEVVGRTRMRGGEVLVAPPDRHLEVVGDELLLSDGPPCNGVRPSVDVLFSSGARESGRRVVAVVLSGAMRDGAAGAAQVERAGGRVVVQDPSDALVSGMPVSALAATAVHDVVPAAQLGAVLTRIVDDVRRAG